LRVHATGLRLLDSIAHCSSLYPSSTEMPNVYDAKVIAQAIYGVAFGFEDDADVSEHGWTRRAKGIKSTDVGKMEHRITRLFFQEGKGALAPSAARL